MSADVAVIGGGIIGCSAAAFLAERGTTVVVFESTAIGAGASGRNSGAVQHPFDPVLLDLHRETLDHYRQLASEDAGFAFPDRPVGLLLLTDDDATARQRAVELAAAQPELAPTVLHHDALRAAEPMLADGLVALRLETGYPIPPDAATHAWAARAERAGARLEVGRAARPWIRDGRVTGVRLDDGTTVPAGSVLVAAGPWTAELLDPAGSWRPIVRTWGVTAQVELPTAPRHVLEEGVVHTVNRVTQAEPAAGGVDSLFSLVSAAGRHTLGSTFVTHQPDAALVAPLLKERGARLVPALREAAILDHRLCARPQSLDGRPLVGRLCGGLFACAGHGPWGL
jgi:D-hydroxyproline dehydrogenase subunit beta